ncbi:hypothetical protein GOBAR_AA14801 [Gossypium barbadense]|uniref:non-specific serine/threonine protein kinase n=1 Tax=Gossypium barbadense TaxID=3634 RepID=A0A2P5XRD0_GOSBA|nr:hypothetical protein GOBAR_AA14801 [Gossypium barbadense]
MFEIRPPDANAASLPGHQSPAHTHSSFFSPARLTVSGGLTCFSFVRRNRSLLRQAISGCSINPPTHHPLQSQLELKRGLQKGAATSSRRRTAPNYTRTSRNPRSGAPSTYTLQHADHIADGGETAPIKAIDFGLSTFYKPGQLFSDIVGSPYYMAPEVLRRNYGKEVDIWSAGVILYIMLCGVPPFWADTEEGIAQAIIRGKIDFGRDPWPKVSTEAQDIVKRMLDPNPQCRMAVHQVLEHPWIQNLENGRNVDLGENVCTRIKQFSLMNKFKKEVLRVVADNLPNEQIDSITEMFHMMDKDEDGQLSLEELKDGLQKLGHSVDHPEVQMLMQAADMDGNGTLSCDEFIIMAVHLKRIGNDEHLREAFNVFDKNQSGYIEFEELEQALLHDNLHPHLIQNIMVEIDKDKDGKISYAEFKTMMLTGMDWKMASRQYSRALLNAVSTKILRQSGQLK